MSHPPSAVLEEGGRIMEKVAASTKRPISMEAVRGWAEAFVPRFPEVAAPIAEGGGWSTSSSR